jgi:YidC/Oxa1 family membrane protein insertase
MDRKSISVIVACFLMLGLWSFVLMPKLYPSKPLPPGPTNAPAAVPTNAAGAPAGPTVGTTAPANGLALNVNTNAPEELVVLTNDNARYTFTSYGGGLKLVELLHYPETVDSRLGKVPQTTHVATLTQAKVPTLAVLDGPAVAGDGIFSLTRTANGVRAEKTLTNGLTIVKDFELSTNYLLTADVRLENHSAQPLSLPPQEWVVGTATPMSPEDNGFAEGMMWYNGANSQEIGASWFANRTLGCLPGTPRSEYRAGQTNVVWAAVHNQFFALVVMPQEPAADTVARKVELPPPSEEEIRTTPRVNQTPQGYETTLVYPALTLATNQTVERKFTVFAGPKEYRTLADIAARFNNNVDFVMGYRGFFGFFSKGLLLSMNALHSAVSLPYGWAIVAITILIKVLFWPLTQASTRSMKRMQALQPQMKAIQEKYKEEPVKAQKKVMELWKQNKVSPLGGCLPMALQMPVFFGFYRMIQSAIELRGAKFLWIKDLSKPDTLFVIPGVNFPFNLLPLIMGATMLWQSHLTPPSPGVDPTQQKIMRYMPLIFLVILYNFSSGLALYWTVNNLLTIAQTKMTKMQQPPPAAPVLTSPPKKRK